MEITWRNTKGIEGAIGSLEGDCDCANGSSLVRSHADDGWDKVCTNIEQLFDLKAYCHECKKEKTIKEWLGDKTKVLYTAICVAHPEWPPGNWNNLTSQEDKAKVEDVDARLKRLRDENLAKAFG